MITSWDIYWITRLDSICLFIGFLDVALLIFLIFFPMIADLSLNFEPIRIVKYEGFFAFIFLLLCLCGVFIPSTKEVVAIYLIPKIANNEQMQKIPDNAAKLLNAKMEEWINETLVEKKEKSK